MSFVYEVCAFKLLLYLELDKASLSVNVYRMQCKSIQNLIFVIKLTNL